MKNLFIKFFLLLFSPFFHARPIKDKVLVVSTTGLGDTMWTIPALRALKEDGKDVSILTGPYGTTLLKNCPYVSNIFSTSHAPLTMFFSLLRSLRMQQFEEVFVFHASQRPLFPLLALLSPKKLHGFKGRNKGLDTLFSHLTEKGFEHEIIYRLQMIGHPSARTEMELFYPKEETKERRIALFPGSKDPHKRWPKEYFVALAERLAAHPYQIYVVGSLEEQALIEAITKQVTGAIPRYKLPLDQTIQFIQSCTVVITNDSGPMHLAFASKVPTLALFSPTAPSKYGPLGVQQASVIERRTPCTPCIRRRCKDNFCMRQISAETVYQEVRKWIE